MENQLQYDYTPLEELPNPSGVTIENEIISKSALSGLVPKVIESIKALLSSSSVPPPPSSADQSTERARYSYHFVGAEQQIAARFPHVKVNQQTKITTDGIRSLPVGVLGWYPPHQKRQSSLAPGNWTIRQFTDAGLNADNIIFWDIYQKSAPLAIGRGFGDPDFEEHKDAGKIMKDALGAYAGEVLLARAKLPGITLVIGAAAKSFAQKKLRSSAYQMSPVVCREMSGSILMPSFKNDLGNFDPVEAEFDFSVCYSMRSSVVHIFLYTTHLALARARITHSNISRFVTAKGYLLDSALALCCQINGLPSRSHCAFTLDHQPALSFSSQAAPPYFINVAMVSDIEDGAVPPPWSEYDPRVRKFAMEKGYYAGWAEEDSTYQGNPIAWYLSSRCALTAAQTLRDQVFEDERSVGGTVNGLVRKARMAVATIAGRSHTLETGEVINGLQMRARQGVKTLQDQRWEDPYGIDPSIDGVQLRSRLQHLATPFWHYCDLCFMVFTTAGILSDHRNTHTGTHPYHCSHCGRGFPSSRGHATHERVYKTTGQCQDEPKAKYERLKGSKRPRAT